jgi:hypothetical protein
MRIMPQNKTNRPTIILNAAVGGGEVWRSP